MNRRIRCHAASVFEIEIGLALVRRHTRIGVPGNQDQFGIVGTQSSHAAEEFDVRHDDVGLADNHNLLAGPSDPSLIQRADIIDGRQIVWRHKVAAVRSGSSMSGMTMLVWPATTICWPGPVIPA